MRKPKKHICKEGARFHVLSWGYRKGRPTTICSEPDCEINHRNESEDQP